MLFIKKVVKRVPQVARLIAQRDALLSEHREISAHCDALTRQLTDVQTQIDQQAAREHSRDEWKAGLSDEIYFWREVLSGRPPEYHADITERSHPERPFLTELRVLLPPKPLEEISVLDVGAGPVSICGWVVDGARLSVFPVDALADVYNELLDEFSFNPPMRSIKVDALGLIEVFGRNRFDLVHMRNALDHTADPMEVTRQMLGVARRGAPVVINGYLNEGQEGGYQGLHQWNVDVRGGRLVFWNKSQTIWVDEVLQDVDIQATAWPERRLMTATLRARS